MKEFNIPEFEYGFYSDCLVECFKEFKLIFDLPIIPDPYTEMLSNYNDGNILDIGAGKAKPFFSTVNGFLKKGIYYSLDTDPQGDFDFQNIDQIPKDLYFSLIIANQVFEHLSVQESIEMMYKAAQHLVVGGKIIITVPNISHPNRQISNITHVTAWGYNSFYMVFKYADLKIAKIARYSKRHPHGLMEKLITKYVSRVYRMDWCDSILMMGIRNE